MKRATRPPAPPANAAELVASIQPKPDVPRPVRHGNLTFYPGTEAAPLRQQVQPIRRKAR
jgi:hypothetical protein